MHIVAAKLAIAQRRIERREQAVASRLLPVCSSAIHLTMLRTDWGPTSQQQTYTGAIEFTGRNSQRLAFLHRVVAYPSSDALRLGRLAAMLLAAPAVDTLAALLAFAVSVL